MSRKRNRPWIEPLLWIVIATGIALVAVGFWLADRYDKSHDLTLKLLSVGATELGFAGLIAAIIYIVFEERVKRDEAKGIAAFLYGIETDSTYFKMIEDYIIRIPFYRYDTVITYRFVEKEEEAYLIEFIVEYLVRNVSKVRQKFHVKGSVDTQSIYCQPHSDWKLGVLDVSVEKDEKKTNPPLSFSQAPSSPHTQVFTSEPVVLQPREKARVKIEQQICKHDHGEDFWQAVIPCSGVRLRLEWPSAWGLQFTHEAFHPNAEDLVERTGREGDTSWKELDLQEPFMVRHGFQFSWKSGVSCETGSARAADGAATTAARSGTPAP